MQGHDQLKASQVSRERYQADSELTHAADSDRLQRRALIPTIWTHSVRHDECYWVRYGAEFQTTPNRSGSSVL